MSGCVAVAVAVVVAWFRFPVHQSEDLAVVVVVGIVEVTKHPVFQFQWVLVPFLS